MNRAAYFAIVCIFAGILFAEPVHGQIEGGAIAAVDEPAEGGGGGSRVTPTKKYTAGKGTTSRSKPAGHLPKTPARPRTPARWDGFVIGDEYTFLNFEVISAEKPYHTRAAKAGGASGLVQVEVLIDTSGRVLTARARTGNKLLHPEAERAALASRFSRPAVYGKPARAVGFLVYRFGREEREQKPIPKRYDFESPFKKNK